MDARECNQPRPEINPQLWAGRPVSGSRSVTSPGPRSIHSLDSRKAIAERECNQPRPEINPQRPKRAAKGRPECNQPRPEINPQLSLRKPVRPE